MNEMSVRTWQERFRAGDFSSRERAVQCEAGWYDWFCRDDALAGRLKKISGVVLGITDPFILDNYYAVSYTHLDVYKRQAQLPPLSSHGPDPAGCGGLL